MGYQDLTPQLRTRLSRVERWVGFFVTFATLLMIGAFAYYVCRTAQRKGWFDTKVHYKTGVDSSSGIKPGDPVYLMGFPVGEVTQVIPNEPWTQWKNVTIEFYVKKGDYNYLGYVWSDTKAKVASLNILSGRAVELQKGRYGLPTIQEEHGRITGMLDRKKLEEALKQEWQRKTLEELREIYGGGEETTLESLQQEFAFQIKEPSGDALLSMISRFSDQQKADLYLPYKKDSVYLIDPLESTAIGERVEKIADVAEQALPNLLSITNLISGVLTNTITITSNINELVVQVRPSVGHLNDIVAQLSDPNGSLGEWLLPTNLNQGIETTLSSATRAIDASTLTLTNVNNLVLTAQATVESSQTNIYLVVSNLNVNLRYLAGITSNLNQQVDANTNFVSEVSSLVVSTDKLLDAMKYHWLFRSAFKKAEEAGADGQAEPVAEGPLTREETDARERYRQFRSRGVGR